VVAFAGPVAHGPALRVALASLLVLSTLGPGAIPGAVSHPLAPASSASPPTTGPVANFTAAIDRMVELIGVAGGGILALVWARVALSWFSHDVTKKIQAKDRARDALIGTLLFVAAVSGMVYGLAHWVVTGS